MLNTLIICEGFFGGGFPKRQTQQMQIMAVFPLPLQSVYFSFPFVVKCLGKTSHVE